MRRSFRDAGGREWEVWDVRPERGAGRVGERRVADRRGDPPPDPALERRAGSERRQRVRASVVPRGFEGGWLVFAAEEERRRLAPLPERWDEWDERRLEEACARARRAAP